MHDLKLEKKYQISCNPDSVSALIKKLIKEIDFLVSSQKIKINLEIAAREMIANAVEHGCSSESLVSKSAQKLIILITLEIKNEKLFLTVKDPGTGFDWKNFNFENDPFLLETGRGLKMIKTVSDHLIFNNSGSQITAVFRLK